MTSSLIPTLNGAAPWQIPLPSDLSPLSKFGVCNPTSLSLPAAGGANYNQSWSLTYNISTAVAASLGFAAYFQGKVAANVQYFLAENIHYMPVALPAGFGAWSISRWSSAPAKSTTSWVSTANY
jgi:hypothetical protein